MTAPDPNGAESHAESDTAPPLETSDDKVIQVDGADKDSMPNIAEDTDEIEASPLTPGLDLDDFEDALDVVVSY